MLTASLLATRGAHAAEPDVSVAPASPAAGPPASFRLRTANPPDVHQTLVPAFLVGGIGVVAMSSAVVLWASGTAAVDDLAQCRPSCPADDIDRARAKLIFGDVSGGIGVLALGLATYMFLTHQPARSSRPRASAGLVPGGAAAQVGVSF